MDTPESGRQREHLLRVLAALASLIFFQAYMVAPLIPRLSEIFGVPAQTMGLVVPAYLIPYGVSTLLYGLLADRLGRARVLLASLGAFVALTALTASAQSPAQLIGWRLLTGIGASGVVPLALVLVGALFPYERRGRPLGWLFGAMAGGAALGSSAGAILEPFVGWRALFLGTAVLTGAVAAFLIPHRRLLSSGPPPTAWSAAAVLSGYRALLASARGARTYGYVFLNSVFHSGVFTWLGLYFSERYRLGELEIGLALLGYGLPGFLLGPPIGRAADRWGRRWLIPAGLAVGALAGALLILDLPLLAAALAVTLLSLGYDLTQPLLAGIVTQLGGPRAGQAMGLNVFLLFTGFGLGSLLFGEALRHGFATALALFTLVQTGATLVALPLFAAEVRQESPVEPP